MILCFLVISSVLLRKVWHKYRTTSSKPCFFLSSYDIVTAFLECDPFQVDLTLAFHTLPPTSEENKGRTWHHHINLKQEGISCGRIHLHHRANLKIPVEIEAQPSPGAAQHGTCGGNGATSWMQEIMGKGHLPSIPRVLQTGSNSHYMDRQEPKHGSL